jgi:hypothetical protein
MIDIMYREIAKDNELLEYKQSKLNDPWIGTYFNGYRYLDPKQKGTYGELFIGKIFENNGFEVKKAEKSNDSYDRYIDGYKTELKFSLAHTDHKNNKVIENSFSLNHVSKNKYWDRLVFLGINYDTDNSIMKFMEKKDFVDLLENKKDDFFTYFSYQQGGKNGKNDDFMSKNTKLLKLLSSPYMREINEW